LNLSILTSQGGQHEITLPDMAELQEIQINGKSLPIRQEGVKLTLPLQPGAQEVLVEWHQQGTSNFLIKGPSVFIGGDAVNAHLTFHMPQNRWTILTGGPRLGPAVLFWSYLVVVILAALALKNFDPAPLKTYEFLLLGLGLTQVPLVTALVFLAGIFSLLKWLQWGWRYFSSGKLWKIALQDIYKSFTPPRSRGCCCFRYENVLTQKR